VIVFAHEVSLRRGECIVPPKTCHIGWLPTQQSRRGYADDRKETYGVALIGRLLTRGGGLGSRPKKMYGERLGDGVEYHLMRPTPRR